MKARKPVGVWMLLEDGQPWMFCRERNVEEGLKTARTLLAASDSLAGPGPLFKRARVWLGGVVQTGTKANPWRGSGVLVGLALALVSACSSPTHPSPPPATLSGVLTVTSSDRDGYALVGAQVPVSVNADHLAYGLSTGRITADSQDGDRRHVEAQRLEVPAAWRSLAPTAIGIQCDIWSARRVGWCQVGIADAQGTATVQGEVRF